MARQVPETGDVHAVGLLLQDDVAAVSAPGFSQTAAPEQNLTRPQLRGVANMKTATGLLQQNNLEMKTQLTIVNQHLEFQKPLFCTSPLK
jgi:hypothetical protein